VDDVFKALADSTRRRLLDRLFKRDGQTLGELCDKANMTRFGVMKHLAVLEEAGLIATRKVGREKFHYLNPVPVQRIADRWISKYAAPFTGALSAMKRHLEDPMGKPMHVYEVYIRSTPEKIWQALTDGTMTRQFFYGTTVESTFQAGAPLTYRGSEGKVMVEGKVIEADPPRRLSQTWRAVYDPETAKERPSRVTWLIEPLGETCKLTVTHDDFDGETKTYHAVARGWNPVLSGLKTLLETGKPLVLPTM
jgi:DNA-binding transcriptional ArsR family regulator/uncharacterized protein YndB with AHSA1/START domain